MSVARVPRRIAFAALVVATLLFALFPLYYALVTSVTPASDLFRAALVPRDWTFEHYRAILGGPFLRSIVNSVVVAGAVVLVSVCLALAAAFALARIRFRGRTSRRRRGPVRAAFPPAKMRAWCSLTAASLKRRAPCSPTRRCLRSRSSSGRSPGTGSPS